MQHVADCFHDRSLRLSFSFALFFQAERKAARKARKKMTKAEREEDAKKIDLTDLDDLTMMPKKERVDQNLMQQIIAEHGVEGLQKFMSKSGMGGSVTTPAELQKRQEEMKKMKGEL